MAFMKKENKNIDKGVKTMTKGFLSRRSRLRLSALVFGGLICGSTASAADLVTATASDYAHGDVGTVTGSRVTTDVDTTVHKEVLKDQGGDIALYNFHQDDLSRLLMRSYDFNHPTALPSLLYDAGTLGTAGAKLAEGTITASPNTHSVAVAGTTIYATGYDLGKIGVAKRTGATLTENTGAAIDLKNDIKTHAGHNFNGNYEIHENDGTVTHRTGSEAAAKVRGEALLVDGENLYAAASINPEGSYSPYDDGYLLHYKIQSDGTLAYESSARIGRNVGNRISKFNDTLFIAGGGGMQRSSGNKNHSEISAVTRDAAGKLTAAKHIKGKALLGATGEDIHDIKVLPNGTAYILAWNMQGSGVGHVYQTTVSNLLSATPDTATPIAEANGQMDAEYYTKRLWLTDGTNLKVYTDGDTAPKKTWAATDFTSNSARSNLAGMTRIAPDHVTGALAAVNLTLPAELGGTAATAAPNPNAVWKTGGDYTDTVTTRINTTTADVLVNIGTDKLGDKSSNVLAALSNHPTQQLNHTIKDHTLQLQVENTVGNPTGVYAKRGRNLLVNGGEVNIITRGREGGNTLTNA